MILDAGLKMHAGDNKDTVVYYGEISLTAALVSIIITAPIGAVASMLLGPILLDKETEE